MNKNRNGFQVMLGLIGMIKPLLGVMCIAIIMGCIGNLMAIFITILGGAAIGNLLGEVTSISMKMIFVLLVVFAVLRGVLRYAEQASNHYIAFKLLARIRHQIFASLRKLAPAKLDGKEKGNLISIITSDIELLEVFYAHTISPIAIAAITSLVMVVFMLIFSYKQNRQMQETFMDNRRKIGDVNSSLQDTLAGIRVVQSFANEKIEREKFEKSNEGFLVSKDANYHCMGSFMSGNLFFQGMMYLITLVFGGWLIAHGKMEAADLAMYALYIGIFISPIQILVELTEMMQKGLSGFRRFLDVVETEP